METMDVVYVTVGTTKFDSLIRAVASEPVLTVFKNRGCKKLILQIGTGIAVDSDLIENKYNIKVEQYNFKFEPVRTDMQQANFTIGHAGAGTCMDIINLQKPGLLVANEDLMNNHQLELAEQMAKEGFIFYCSLKRLPEFLKTVNLNALMAYNQGENMPKFVDFLNKLMSL